MEVSRLGVLGGTFNPVHLGHLHIAAHTQNLFDLSLVLFAVSTNPPHKTREQLAHFTHRYTMVSLATLGVPSFLPSMVELETPASPYSIDTVDKLLRHYAPGGSSFYFIAGADSLRDLPSWHRSEELLDRCNFVFVVRPGLELADPGSLLPFEKRTKLCDLRGLPPELVRRETLSEAGRLQNRVFVVDIGAPDISASQIRALASAGDGIQDLVPPPVLEYIQKLHLYGVR